jgi:magnesium transporter
MLYEEEVNHSDTRTNLSDAELLEGVDYESTRLELIDYAPDRLTEEILDDPADAVRFLDSDSVTWLNVAGLRNTNALESIRENFSIHPLVLEDVLRPFQRPKFEVYDDYLFIINKLFEPGAKQEIEQIAFVLGDRFLITFQETSGDVFDAVRRRIREGTGRLRKAGPGYLTYELIDAVVDAYFPRLETIGDELEQLEDDITREVQERESLEDIHDIRRDLLVLRRTAWSQREMLGQLQQKETQFVSEETRIYFRDAYDHAIRILDIIESYRDMSSSLQELHLTVSSNKMNNIMKVLTIIATIFIPLTFVAGIYGMNFNPEVSPWNMPELNWYYGYPFSLGIMTVMTLGMIVFFRRKGWL